jgi:hypothetical protein
MRYTITSTFVMSLRSDHTTAAAKTALLDPGKPAKGDDLWIAAQTTSLAKAGDKWLHVKEMDGKPVDGWMAIIHLGKEYCTVQDSGVIPPPPPGGNDSVKRIIKAVITYETEDGRTLTKEVLPE